MCIGIKEKNEKHTHTKENNKNGECSVPTTVAPAKRRGKAKLIHSFEVLLHISGVVLRGAPVLDCFGRVSKSQ